MLLCYVFVSWQRWWLELELEKRFVRHRVKNSRDYAWRTRTVLLCVKLNPISLVENVLASVANASALSLASKMMDSSPIPSIHYFGCVFFLLYLRIILSPISSWLCYGTFMCVFFIILVCNLSISGVEMNEWII